MLEEGNGTVTSQLEADTDFRGENSGFRFISVSEKVYIHAALMIILVIECQISYGIDYYGERETLKEMY
jgi:hypothetical protein